LAPDRQSTIEIGKRQWQSPMAIGNGQSAIGNRPMKSRIGNRNLQSSIVNP
jgi:hypothetical protein